MVTIEQIQEVKQRANKMRRHIIEMIGFGKAGHLGGAYSCADIVASLYFYKMEIDPENPGYESRDRLILSKGHAALVQYAALVELGYFDRAEIYNAKKLGSMLQGHPDLRKTPGIEANTGSLGQGLSIGLGMALGLRLDGIRSKVYVILGDGETAEGQVWEAAMAASNFRVDNLVAILDRNRLQSTGFTDERFNINPVKEKWEAFGWKVIEIEGHDVKQICDALDKADEIKSQPVMIIADTIKGKGVSFAENNPNYHNCTLTEEQYIKALEETEKSVGVRCGK